MSETEYQSKLGGRFLIEPIGTNPVFSRERFSDEHKEIEEMIKEFATERIRGNLDEINKYDKDLSLTILRHPLSAAGL